MGISLSSSGSFANTERWLNRLASGDIYRSLERYGRVGADALARATPKETGETAASWTYRIMKDRSGVTIEWYNTNVVDGVVIAVIIQYGHGTGTGGYVRGIDYINPAMRPIFDTIAANIVKEVSA